MAQYNQRSRMKIIDNINTLLGDDLKASIRPKDKLKIAASCFSIYAYEALKSEFSKIESLEFIFTAPTFVANEVTDKFRKERREFFIPKNDRERSLYGSEFEIQLRNKLTQRAIARECAAWMRRKAVFRSNKTKAPMQQFACIESPEQDVAYMPMNGFTAVDLGYQQGDAISNLVNRFEEPAFTATYLQLFDQIWNDPEKLEEVTAVICDHIDSVYQDNSPERIYFLMLYNIFSEFLEGIDEDVLPNDLSRTSGDSFGIPLNRINWGNYDLVVIDESHNFRNNDVFKKRETRYQRLMNKVIREGVKTKVLMLSATPVNNRFNDLRNQLALAYEGDSENLSKKLRSKRSVEEIFRRAQAAFNLWSKLPIEQRTSQAILGSLDFDFFELLDSVTIARSRKHIQTYYDTKDIGQFPERLKPLSWRCPLTYRNDVLGLNDIFKQLALLKLAVYAPISYILPSRLSKYEELYDTLVEGGKSKLRQADRERSLQALMTTNLLKRLESSVESFRLTLGSLQRKVVGTIELIETFQQTGCSAAITDYTAGLEALEAEEDDFVLPEDVKIGGKVQISLSDMDVERWKHELAVDQILLEELLASMQKITPDHDAKLQHLKNLVLNKITNPINDGNKKVLIFTAFADTANYLYNNLAEDILHTNGLHTGKVTGKDAPKSTLKKSYDFQSLLTLFSPRAKEKALVLSEEPREIDILIGTDCISEGQNLQDCDYLINYDIHWNPVRIIQRFGRIDRIGSQNTTIQLVNYWPDISLDDYINLKERVENRMMIADVTATGDDNLLTAQSSDVVYRKEQLRRLQDEVVKLEELKTGVSITDLGLNEFRMDLLNSVKAYGDLGDLPKGMHAVVPANPAAGIKPGVIFTLRNRNESVHVSLHNRLHPYYLIYIGRDGEIISNHTEVKRLLDLVRVSCKGQSEPLQSLCHLFNQQTDEGRNMKAYSDLLSNAIRSMMEVKEEKDLDSLFSGGKTTALLNTIAGLDDFELIAFLVVQEER